MPLLGLRGTPFVSRPPPTDIGEDERVLVIELTGEVFRDHE